MSTLRRIQLPLVLCSLEGINEENLKEFVLGQGSYVVLVRATDK